MVGFKARLDHANYIDVSRLDARLQCATPGMVWVSGCPGPLLAILGYPYAIARLSLGLSLISSGKIRKTCESCFSSTVSAFQRLCRSRFWQQLLWSELCTLGLLGAPGFMSDTYENILKHTKIIHTICLYNLKGCVKQHLSISPSDHAVALSNSSYLFPWFVTHLQP